MKDSIIAVIAAIAMLVILLFYIGETNKNNPVEVRCAK